jgi:hypothetical protein
VYVPPAVVVRVTQEITGYLSCSAITTADENAIAEALASAANTRVENVVFESCSGSGRRLRMEAGHGVGYGVDIIVRRRLQTALDITSELTIPMNGTDQNDSTNTSKLSDIADTIAASVLADVTAAISSGTFVASLQSVYVSKGLIAPDITVSPEVTISAPIIAHPPTAVPTAVPTAEPTGISMCPQGTYLSSSQDSKGIQVCESCRIGTYNPNIGASVYEDCLPCAAGTYAQMVGSVMCTACEAGQYNPYLEQSKCIACPNGTYGIDTGATSSQTCQGCMTGTASEAGAHSCSKCGAGLYASSERSAECDACPGAIILVSS